MGITAAGRLALINMVLYASHKSALIMPRCGIHLYHIRISQLRAWQLLSGVAVTLLVRGLTDMHTPDVLQIVFLKDFKNRIQNILGSA